MKQKQPKLWYVVADAGRATAYIRQADSDGYDAVANWTSDLALPADRRPRFSDRPGRVFDARGSSARHAAETTSAAELTKHAFGRDLAQALNKARTDGAFERLVLFAAPRLLHQLRVGLDRPTAAAVVHSEGKDLTKLPAEKLYEAFEAARSGPLLGEMPRP